MSSPTGAACSGASDAGTDVRLRLAVIGCGNPVRQDDGVGVEVVCELRRRGVGVGVELIDAGTGGFDVMFRVRGARHVVIVDACQSGSEAGAVFRLPAREATTAPEQAFTLHGLRWDHALYAGRRMFGDSFADHAEVILVEAQELGFGIGLSPAVRQAAARVVDLLTPLVQGDE